MDLLNIYWFTSFHSFRKSLVDLFPFTVSVIFIEVSFILWSSAKTTYNDLGFFFLKKQSTLPTSKLEQMMTKKERKEKNLKIVHI